ncbi:hypothetical protein KF707_19640 [Candidatus Obscuribacterales bacterium]|nr:hypothetical protein [Candidatus Obscuribacterales bacterium]MBX3138450.1 hypothetical protein [Candidatus Obscuribacterales bacterium]
MTASLQSPPRRNSQVVAFTNNRVSRGTTGDSMPTAPASMNTRGTWPVAFTDNTVPVETIQQPTPVVKPHLVPLEAPSTKTRKQPLLAKFNRGIQAVLVAMCGIAICAYGLDVVVSHDVGKLQEQARRTSEQNSELSAQLLKSISYGEIQESTVGRFGLRVPEQVVIVKEQQPPTAIAYKMHKHHLPLMSGY